MSRTPKALKERPDDDHVDDRRDRRIHRYIVVKQPEQNSDVAFSVVFRSGACQGRHDPRPIRGIICASICLFRSLVNSSPNDDARMIELN
jgi:hypothetical protein